MASINNIIACVAFAILFCFSSINCIEDYCLDNLINSNTTRMQFTKEASEKEFGVVKKFKGLHCCAKGYSSIQWMKDGEPHPWSGALSSFILYPESANQTIYSQSVSSMDAGNYTCILRNNEESIAHHIQLVIYDGDSIPDDPKATFVSQSTEAVVGESVRLFCEGFVGYVDLPDATSEAVWMKNDTIVEGPHIRQERVERENGLTFGTYLFIDKVQPQDYGTYFCKISKPGKSKLFQIQLDEKVLPIYMDRNPVPVRQIILVFCLVAVVAATPVVIWINYGLKTRVFLKDNFGNVEHQDGKANDVMIVYSPNDEDIALGTLMSILKSRYNYECSSKQFPKDINCWYTNLLESVNRNRRIIAVISPATLKEHWDSRHLYEALKQLKAFNDQAICVLLKEIPKTKPEIKNSAGETLSSVVRSMNVIQWKRGDEDKFWLSLRLRLPPKRHEDMDRREDRNTHTLRLRNGCGESLHDLV